MAKKGKKGKTKTLDQLFAEGTVEVLADHVRKLESQVAALEKWREETLDAEVKAKRTTGPPIVPSKDA
jgi:hypothetical protein